MNVTGRSSFVSFLSDYGHTDEFVGVCHAVMLDVTHEIPAFDVRAGALALVRAVQYLPEGVVLAIVDPGVGSDRRCIAVEVDDGVLVGPDNGLLAPAAAHLAAGVAIGELGPEVDPATLAPGLVPLPREDEDGTVVGEVLWVDR